MWANLLNVKTAEQNLIWIVYAYMGLVARKPVFGVSEKARFKAVSSATETS